ncbi:hypothetical protein CYMTET_38559 [Cymbomonas tetramitiformis]|uniref:Uncharacterized protein n=1 Tax=Cymbomonas tetramitiformis TaxID=36881 RepID=A0AAE0CDW1_9CHLO|nr:hypothetical protein CYMTET_38559 [Cymbomonas tetramitiformis]
MFVGDLPDSYSDFGHVSSFERSEDPTLFQCDLFCEAVKESPHLSNVINLHARANEELIRALPDYGPELQERFRTTRHNWFQGQWRVNSRHIPNLPLLQDDLQYVFAAQQRLLGSKTSKKSQALQLEGLRPGSSSAGEAAAAHGEEEARRHKNAERLVRNVVLRTVVEEAITKTQRFLVDELSASLREVLPEEAHHQIPEIVGIDQCADGSLILNQSEGNEGKARGGLFVALFKEKYLCLSGFDLSGLDTSTEHVAASHLDDLWTSAKAATDRENERDAAAGVTKNPSSMLGDLIGQASLADQLTDELVELHQSLEERLGAWKDVDVNRHVQDKFDLMHMGRQEVNGHFDVLTYFYDDSRAPDSYLHTWELPFDDLPQPEPGQSDAEYVAQFEGDDEDRVTAYDMRGIRRLLLDEEARADYEIYHILQAAVISNPIFYLLGPDLHRYDEESEQWVEESLSHVCREVKGEKKFYIRVYVMGKKGLQAIEVGIDDIDHAVLKMLMHNFTSRVDSFKDHFQDQPTYKRRVLEVLTKLVVVIKSLCQDKAATESMQRILSIDFNLVDKKALETEDRASFLVLDPSNTKFGGVHEDTAWNDLLARFPDLDGKVKTVFRSELLQHHPDRSSQASSGDRTRALIAARDYLLTRIACLVASNIVAEDMVEDDDSEDDDRGEAAAHGVENAQALGFVNDEAARACAKFDPKLSELENVEAVMYQLATRSAPSADVDMQGVSTMGLMISDLSRVEELFGDACDLIVSQGVTLSRGYKKVKSDIINSAILRFASRAGTVEAAAFQVFHMLSTSPVVLTDLGEFSRLLAAAKPSAFPGGVQSEGNLGKLRALFELCNQQVTEQHFQSLAGVRMDTIEEIFLAVFFHDLKLQEVTRGALLRRLCHNRLGSSGSSEEHLNRKFWDDSYRYRFLDMARAYQAAPSSSVGIPGGDADFRKAIGAMGEASTFFDKSDQDKYQAYLTAALNLQSKHTFSPTTSCSSTSLSTQLGSSHPPANKAPPKRIQPQRVGDLPSGLAAAPISAVAPASGAISTTAPVAQPGDAMAPCTGPVGTAPREVTPAAAPAPPAMPSAMTPGAVAMPAAVTLAAAARPAAMTPAAAAMPAAMTPAAAAMPSAMTPGALQCRQR